MRLSSSSWTPLASRSLTPSPGHLRRGMSFRTRFLRPLIRPSVLGVQCFCVGLLANAYAVDLRFCTGVSMLPTLQPGGELVLNVRLPFYRFLSALWPGSSTPLFNSFRTGSGGPLYKADPSQGTGLCVGDVVVAASPHKTGREVCKRVLGLAGDTVLFDARVDPPPDHEQQWNTKNKAMSGGQFSKEISSEEPTYIVVPKGHVWLSGDNLSASIDSRHYGPVPLGLIRGKLVAILLPSFIWLSRPSHQAT